MTSHFSIGEALRFGWHTTKAHSGVLFQGMLALFALQILSSIVDKVLGGTLQGFLAMVLVSICSIIVGAGYMHIALKLAEQKHASYKDLIPPGALVWRFFLVSLIVGLIVVGGLILLIIPGIYFAIRFSMARFAVLDGAAPLEALRISSKLTKGVQWQLLGFLVVLILLNIAGALLLLVGLLLSIPVSMLAAAHVYLKLKHRS